MKDGVNLKSHLTVWTRSVDLRCELFENLASARQGPGRGLAHALRALLHLSHSAYKDC